MGYARDVTVRMATFLFTFFLLSFPELIVGITKRLKNTEVLEGESCSFECVLSHESTEGGRWLVNGTEVGHDGRFRAFNKGRKYTLNLKKVLPSDAGEVVFSINDMTSKASLVVRGKYGVLKKVYCYVYICKGGQSSWEATLQLKTTFKHSLIKSCLVYFSGNWKLPAPLNTLKLCGIQWRGG